MCVCVCVTISTHFNYIQTIKFKTRNRTLLYLISASLQASGPQWPRWDWRSINNLSCFLHEFGGYAFFRDFYEVCTSPLKACCKIRSFTSHVHSILWNLKKIRTFLNFSSKFMDLYGKFIFSGLFFAKIYCILIIFMIFIFISSVFITT